MQILAFEQTTLRSPVAGLYGAQVIMPRFFKRDSLDGEELEEKEAPINKALEQLLVLKKHFGGRYLTNDNFTAGDHHVWATVHLLVRFELIDLEDDHKEIKKWYDLCSTERGPQAIKK